MATKPKSLVPATPVRVTSRPWVQSRLSGKGCIDAPPSPQSPSTKGLEMKTPGEAAEISLRMVREAKELSYDTESTGLDWRYNAPIGYVTAAKSGSGIESVYVPIRHGGGGNLLGGVPMEKPDGDWDIHEYERELAKAFDDRNRIGVGVTIGHHTKFDCHISANAGIMLGRSLACTQNFGPLIDEYQRSYSLEASAERFGVTAKLSQDMYDHLGKLFGVPAKKGSMEHFWRTAGNDPVVVDYATGDGITTLELYWKQLEELTNQQLWVVAKLESDLIWTLFRMERKGIRVDMDAIESLREATEKQIIQALRSLGDGFNVRSPTMIKELMKKKGYTDWPLTDKGNPSFTEKWLKKNPVGKQIIEVRRMTNLLNSFVNPLRERHIYQGRVHATLNQLKNDDNGTISGRFSCTDPNLQQVPKRNKELAKPFRRLFIPDDGKIFWERDWSQCEPRLFAHYSGDENLVAGYNQKPFRDAHQVVADLLNVERDPTAKRMNMGIFTGMQPKTFSEHMDWPLAKAAEAHAAWFRNFPKVRTFQNNAKSRLKNRGYVMTLLGRRCRLEAPRWAYRGTSKIIQGGNADIAKYKLLEMDRMCEDNGDIVEILMTVHDSFNGQREDTPEAKALMEEIEAVMVDVQGPPFNLRVPFLVDGFDGPNWCVASFGED